MARSCAELARPVLNERNSARLLQRSCIFRRTKHSQRAVCLAKQQRTDWELANACTLVSGQRKCPGATWMHATEDQRARFDRDQRLLEQRSTRHLASKRGSSRGEPQRR